MKVSQLPPADAPNGSEIIPITQTVAGVPKLVQMPAADLAQAGTRPTAAELQAAVAAALAAGSGIDFSVVGNVITISVDVTQIESVAALNTALAAKQDENSLLTSLAALATAGQAGKVVKVNATGDGFELDPDLEATGGAGVIDGTYGDVVISNNGTKMIVSIATDEAYAVGWNADMTPPTKNAVFAKIETVVSALAGKLSAANVGVANGVAALDAGGKVPASQLPSYVDDVLEFSSSAAFPNPGETGKIYVALDTSAQWRWSGTAYVQLVASPGTTDQVPEGPTNKYYTDIRVRAAPMTGLIQTVGTPAAADSLLTVLGKLWRQSFRTLTSADMPANVPVVGGDGVMEIGQYLDFHVPNLGDGRDFAGRIQVVANGSGFAFSLGANAILVGGTQVALATDLAGKLDKTGGVLTGNLTAVDFHADRGDGTGVIFFGGSGIRYLNYDGANYGLNGAGLVVGGNISSSSDRRLKSDIRPLTGASEIVASLQAYRFTMSEAPSLGLIAQDVQAVLPELVTADDNGMLAVDYSKLAAVLIADNNALRARLEALETTVAKLVAAA